MSQGSESPRPGSPRGSGCQLQLAGWLLLGAVAMLGIDAWRKRNVPLLSEQAQPRPIIARGDLASDELATIDLFEENSNAVVHISTKERVYRRNLFTYDAMDVPSGQGSGFVWSADGYVVTNFHVIQESSGRTVTLASGASYEGHFVGGDPTHDLAVLKIDAPAGELSAIQIGTSADLRVGQKVFAIGSPFGLDQTLTTGIVSGIGRTITSIAKTRIRDVIQTDAAINPGNSGGPLLDSAGRLIGINTAIYSPSGSSAGIGFAVPVDTINRIVPEIIRTGEPPRAGLGIQMLDDYRTRRAGVRGVVVAQVVPGSAAERAGLRDPQETESGLRMDVITAVNGEPVTSRADLIRLLAEKQVGERITLQLNRGGQALEVPIELQDLR